MKYREAKGWKWKLFDGSLFLHRLLAHMKGHEIYRTHRCAYSIISHEPRLAALELASYEVYRYGTEGNTAELGVYTGGFASAINHFFPDRKLYLFDTFEGFDTRDKKFDKENGFSSIAEGWLSDTSEGLVLSKMEHPENCIIRKGWFPDTAEGVDDKFCFVSIDANLYQPILAGLEFFYPRLNHGGVIMIHDFNNQSFQGARQAVKEFCDKNSISYVCLPDCAGSAVITR